MCGPVRFTQRFTLLNNNKQLITIADSVSTLNITKFMIGLFTNYHMACGITHATHQGTNQIAVFVGALRKKTEYCFFFINGKLFMHTGIE